MQEWIEADAFDGFWLLFDVYEDAIDTFVEDFSAEKPEQAIDKTLTIAALRFVPAVV